VGITCLLAIPIDSLLYRALASLLPSPRSELNLVTSTANDLPGLVGEISDLKPDMVILAESTPLAAKDMLGRLLMSHTELRVVVVSEDTNWLSVFHKKDMEMTSQADLLDVLYFDCFDQV
jgi:hypothetical protein